MKDLKIGIILGSTREGRVSPQVGKWVKEVAEMHDQEASYEIVDIKEYKLPLLGESNDYEGVNRWKTKIAELDGFVFITCEYNHSMSAALKNALDSLREEWYNKACAIVSYGSTGGVRAAEHLRGVAGELLMADVRVNPALSLFLDFEDMVKFKPQNLHINTVNQMLDQLLVWTKALKEVRKNKK